MTAIPTITEMITPALAPRRFRTVLLLLTVAFFPGFFWVRAVLVLNWFLLFLYHGGVVCSSVASFPFVLIKRSGPHPDLSEGIPSESAKQHEEEDETNPVGNEGERIGDDFASVRQTDAELRLPAREGWHRVRGEANPDHP